VEFAGGYGLLTRLMRDRGFDFHWHDRIARTSSLVVFEWDELEGKISSRALTAFEVIEHVSNPVAFLKDAIAGHELRPSSFPRCCTKANASS